MSHWNFHRFYPGILYLWTVSDIFFYVKGSRYKHHQDDKHAIKLKYLNWYVKNLKEIKLNLRKGTKMKLTIPL